MAFDEKIKIELMTFVQNFQINIGKSLFFSEAICTERTNFDRHFTTFSSTEFKLSKIGVRFSGARLMFEGERIAYEIALDNIILFEERENEVEFIEAYSEKIYRKTILKFTDDNN
jgi:hypothetical protein